MRRGTALLVGLLLTVTLSLLALSLLLTTAGRRRGRGDPLGLQTLLAADDALRAEQLDLAAPRAPRRTETPQAAARTGVEVESVAPRLVGLARGRSDLRAGSSAGWGEVWRVGATGRRRGEPRGRGIDAALARPGVPLAAEWLSVAEGVVSLFGAGESPGRAPRWEVPGTGAILVPTPPEVPFLRARLAGYAEYRDALRRRPGIALVSSPGTARGIDVRSGKVVFEWRGDTTPAGGPAPVAGDALAGEGCRAVNGTAPGAGCSWRTIAVVAIGRSVTALDLSRETTGTVPALWTRVLEGSVTGVGLGAVRANDGLRFAVFATAGERLAELSLEAGQDLAAWRLPGNGPLSAPALADLDADGALDVAYAGDGLGRLWRFDLNGSGGRPILRGDGGTGAPVVQAPAVLRAGTDPASGEDLLSVAWVSGEAGARIACVIDAGSRREDAGTASAALVPVPLDAPRSAACGELGPPRLPGWRLELRPAERPSSALAVHDGSIFLTTAETCPGAPGCPAEGIRGRLYRLAALNADPCEGAACCTRSPAVTRRGELLPGSGALGSVSVVADPDGRPVARVGRAGGRPLVAPLEARPVVTGWREGEGR